MFHVGQSVVCVGDYSEIATLSWAKLLSVKLPVNGAVYTVRRLVQRPGGYVEYGIMLEEIVNKPHLLDKMGEGGEFALDDKRLTSPDEMAFDSRDFRPLLTVKQFTTAGILEPA